MCQRNCSKQPHPVCLHTVHHCIAAEHGLACQTGRQCVHASAEYHSQLLLSQARLRGRGLPAPSSGQQHTPATAVAPAVDGSTVYMHRKATHTASSASQRAQPTTQSNTTPLAVYAPFPLQHHQHNVDMCHERLKKVASRCRVAQLRSSHNCGD